MLTEPPLVHHWFEPKGGGLQFTCDEAHFQPCMPGNEIDQRRPKSNHPWTNGQVERMNRIIKDATTKRYHYDTHSQLKTHVSNVIAAYNYARRPKTLKGLTPFEYICKTWSHHNKSFVAALHR